MKNLNTVTTSVFSFVSLGAKIERSEKYLLTLGQIDLARQRAANEANLGAVMNYSEAFQAVSDAEYLSAKGYPNAALQALRDAQLLVLTAMRS